MENNQLPRLTPSPGCYADGARGRYIMARILQFACDWGYAVDASDYQVVQRSGTSQEREGDQELIDELEESIETWLEQRYALAGHYWGWSETGDWGLWSTTEAYGDTLSAISVLHNGE